MSGASADPTRRPPARKLRNTPVKMATLINRHTAKGANLQQLAQTTAEAPYAREPLECGRGEKDLGGLGVWGLGLGQGWGREAALAGWDSTAGAPGATEPPTDSPYGAPPSPADSSIRPRLTLLHLLFAPISLPFPHLHLWPCARCRLRGGIDVASARLSNDIALVGVHYDTPPLVNPLLRFNAS